MSSSKRSRGSRSSNPSDSNSSDNQRAQQAMDRLDAAVRNLGDAAKDSLADRAALILEETTARLKQEFGHSNASEKGNPDGRRRDTLYDDGASAGGRATMSDRKSRRSRRHRGSADHEDTRDQPGYWRDDWRATTPVRDLDRKRIWGICAGIAPYLGLKIWVVRCIAITGLVFMPQVILPAYIIGAFVLDPIGGSPRQRTRRAKRSGRRARKARAQFDTQPPVMIAPRTRLKTVRGTLDEAELRLRRMEQHVTSTRFELQRELNKIDV